MMRSVPMIVAVSALIASAPGALWSAGGQAKVLLNALDPNKSVSLALDNQPETPLGDTSPIGDLAIALDPSKSYVVYKLDCERYVIVVQDSDKDKECRSQSQQPPPEDQCGPCVPVGIVIPGSGGLTFQKTAPPSASTQQQGSGGMGKGVAIGLGLAAAGIAGGVYYATQDDTGGPQQQPFILTNVNVNIVAAPGQRGCNIFVPSYTATGIVNVDAGGNGSLEVRDPAGVNRLHRFIGGLIENNQALSFASNGTFNWSSSTGRSFQSRIMNGRLNRTGSGTVEEIHQFVSGGAPGPTPGCNESHLLTITP